MGWGPGFGGGRGAIWVRGWAVVSQGNGQKTAGRADGPGVGWGGILGWEALGAEKEVDRENPSGRCALLCQRLPMSPPAPKPPARHKESARPARPRLCPPAHRRASTHYNHALQTPTRTRVTAGGKRVGILRRG